MKTSPGGFPASLLLFTLSVPIASARLTRYITGTSITGVTQELDVARTPALFTGNFGDCLGGNSLFNITKFDAAYYTDNSTVLFHLDGQSSIANESLVMRFSMDAYGENRFQMTFDPCFTNIDSLCPLNASVPVAAWAVFPVGAQQVGNIPSLAFNIPDFEGSVTLQIFGNSSQSEIGCFQASMRNGNTMSYPEIVGPILALFVLVAMVASFATAAYGTGIPAMRTHHAHSLSVMVIFETFQSIFFSGTLQLEFPSVLSAWWSNFAWSAGQIYSRSVVETANIASGVGGNASQVGAAGSSVQVMAEAGALLAQQIYGRSLTAAQGTTGQVVSRTTEATHQLSRRYNSSNPDDYAWAGVSVNPGVILPGTWTGFPGTLSALGIPAVDTFAVGLIWLLVLVAILSFSLVALKFSLEGLVKMKRIKEDRLLYFRKHWIQYTGVTILRTLFAAFAMVMTLTFFQLSFSGSARTKALASVFFLLLFVGLSGLATHACYTRLGSGSLALQPDRILLIRRTKFNHMPYIAFIRSSILEKLGSTEHSIVSIPWFQLAYHDNDSNRIAVTQDEPYIQRYGWLSARYRRTRWWFFAVYLAHQLFRAAIVGGAHVTPTAQVYSLLVYDITAFLVILTLNPFEGRRNTALAVWMLGLARILTTALSIAFLPQLGVGRILATALGIIIIVVQGLLTIGVLVLVVLSAISSYFSLARDRDPLAQQATATLDPLKARYLAHLTHSTLDIRRPSRAEKAHLKDLETDATAVVEPSFTVNSVRRISKIYDEDEDTFAATSPPQSLLRGGGPPSSLRSASSCTSSSGNLPRGARAVRASWSAADFVERDAASASARPEPGLARRLSGFSSTAGRYDGALGSFQESEEEGVVEEMGLSSGAGSLVDGGQVRVGAPPPGSEEERREE